MDLEMRDYELTVSELHGQLAEKDTNIAELQAEIEREKRRSGSLQDQLVHLSTQEATERERAEKMKVRFLWSDLRVELGLGLFFPVLFSFSFW